MSPRGAAGGHTTKEQDRDTSPGLRLRRLLFPAGGAARERGASVEKEGHLFKRDSYSAW